MSIKQKLRLDFNDKDMNIGKKKNKRNSRPYCVCKERLAKNTCGAWKFLHKRHTFGRIENSKTFYLFC